jgi:hypothetical protein
MGVAILVPMGHLGAAFPRGIDAGVEASHIGSRLRKTVESHDDHRSKGGAGRRAIHAWDTRVEFAGCAGGLGNAGGYSTLAA